mmetsp:Transcript_24403/g.22174  ORF Transcript_24403/g.22174 Transcript_24403/m.22174 type:complete len:183 (+) Transcript_24403:33-581(+)
MIVYKDVISDDEVLSDAFVLQQVIDGDGTAIEGFMFVESKNIVKSGDDVDVGCGNAFGSGGGEDDEGGGVDNSAQTVNNVIDGFQYTETQIGSLSDFKSWIKEYLNNVVIKLREKGKPKEFIQAFKAQATNIAKYLFKNFKDLQFYLGPSYNSETMIFSLYPEGALTPNFYYIMGALTAEKF